MIDLLLKAIDRVIDLAKIKEKRIKARYEEIYKPSFAELQSVHSDYLSMFTELDSRLQKIGPELPKDNSVAIETLLFLKARRNVLLPVRSKFWALQAIFEGEEWQRFSAEERAFLLSIVNYFYLGGLMSPSPHAYCSRSTSILDKLEKTIKYQCISIEDIRRECRESCANLQISWTVSVERFNELRLWYIEGSS
jgi:hypothetical protein